jgi:hypothetical protein
MAWVSLPGPKRNFEEWWKERRDSSTGFGPKVSATGWLGTSMPTASTRVTLLIRSLPGAAGSTGSRPPVKSPVPRAR